MIYIKRVVFTFILATNLIISGLITMSLMSGNKNDSNQVGNIPNPYSDQHHQQQINLNQSTQPYKAVLYFCNWSIYQKNHFPEDIAVSRLTHILYAFCNVKAESGKVFLTDLWADVDSPASRTNHNESGGCLGRFAEIRKKNPNLKLLLSIGGYSFSKTFRQGVDSEHKRNTFVKSAIDLLKQFKLDGLDLDWEYPGDEEEALAYVDIIKKLRMELDSEALRLGVPRGQFDLSIAAPAGIDHSKKLKIAEMDQYLSFWNLMTYDFSGSWSHYANYQSNLYNNDVRDDGTIDKNDPGINSDDSVKYYMSQGVASSKIILGMPLYGRSFENTKGRTYSFDGTGQGSWEPGVWDYKALPPDGSQEYVDLKAVSAYCYDENQKLFISYDNEKTVAIKAQYVKSWGLGGGMWWESSADHPINSSRSIIGSFTNTMGDNLEYKENIYHTISRLNCNTSGTSNWTRPN